MKIYLIVQHNDGITEVVTRFNENEEELASQFTKEYNNLGDVRYEMIEVDLAMDIHRYEVTASPKEYRISWGVCDTFKNETIWGIDCEARAEVIAKELTEDGSKTSGYHWVQDATD